MSTTTPRAHKSRAKANFPHIKVSATSLRKARIDSITLCQSHIPGAVEIVVNHKDRWPLPLFKSFCELDLTSGACIVEFCKPFHDGTEQSVTLALTGVSSEIVDRLVDGLWSTSIEKEQEIILIVPRPRTEAEYAKVGTIIATTSK